MSIIINLQGGLGNTMFQYAFARNVSLLRNDELKLYGDRLNKAKAARDFELYRFGIKLDKDNGEFRKVLTESSMNYEPSLKQIALNLPGKNIEYDGYFQDIRYFEENKEHIVKDFTWDISLLSERALEWKNKIERLNKRQETVALHVRRRDYLDSDSVMVSLGIDYYAAAEDLIHKKYPNAYYLCVSDDIAWCKENLPGCNEYIDEDLYVENMYLMSLCKHQIIANSTFSWWAAYLNKNKKKIVICPKKWFKSNDVNMCPEDWIKV